MSENALTTPKLSHTASNNAHVHGEATQQPKALVTELNEKTDAKHHAPAIHHEGDIKILKKIELSCDGMCCRFSENGEKLAVGLSNGDIKIFRGSTGSCIYHLADDDTKADRLPATSLCFIPADVSSRGELLVATYASGTIKYWHISTATALQTLHEPCQLLTSSLSPSMTHLIAGGSSEEIFIYDLETGSKINVCSPSENRHVMDGHRFRIFALKHHPLHDNVFCSGGWDDTVQIWDQREAHAVRRIFGPHICGDGIDIDEKHDHILTASWRKEDVLQVWDFKEGSNIRSIPPDFDHTSMLYCGQWLGKEHMICGGSDNNMVRIINKATLATTGMLSNLPAGVYSVDHDRHRLLNHRHHGSDVTMITAVAGNHLYFISNAVHPGNKREDH